MWRSGSRPPLVSALAEMQSHSGTGMQVYQLMREQLGVERPLSELHPEAQLDASDDEDEESATAAGDAGTAGGAETLNVDAGSDEHDEL